MTSGNACSEVAARRCRAAWVLSAAAAGVLVCVLLAGCGGAATVTGESPRMQGYEVTAGSDGTEQSQRVVVTATFDRRIVAGADARDDLVVRIDGAEIDDATAVCTVAPDGARALRVVIAAAPDVGDPAQGPYFALRRGKLTIAARNDSGGLPHVTGEDGESSAVWRDVSCIVPSGLAIGIVSETPGGEGRAATTTFRVVRPPQLRVCSWLEMEPGGHRVFVHNHLFLKYDAVGYASHLAESLSKPLGADFTVSSEADCVTVTAGSAADGQRIRPAVVEGPQ